MYFFHVEYNGAVGLIMSPPIKKVEAKNIQKTMRKTSYSHVYSVLEVLNDKCTSIINCIIIIIIE